MARLDPPPQQRISLCLPKHKLAIEPHPAPTRQHSPVSTFSQSRKQSFGRSAASHQVSDPNSFRKVFRGDVNQIYLRVESLPLAPPKDLLEEKVDDVYRQTIVVNVVPAPLSHLANELPFSVPLDSWESNEYVAGVLRKIYACITQARVECYSIHY